ncbi:hypothetical protein FOZ63_028736 [Perkinsus olseni]|uniref:Peptidase A1 domain-containing protein n=2 Tax=Perkinsus olseni TaxID=32597 RepID=A0A7J6QC49_PEROL|nr:hypothetical protein FOZ62_026981 [Perkinsus olseni]KAF4723572.1 hypothetical protein FOZ63_028736 [Perkinsus olseni]
MFFILEGFCPPEFCLGVHGCSDCDWSECSSPSQNLAKMTFKDGRTISLIATPAFLDVPEQDRQPASLGSQMKVKYSYPAPFALLGLGFPQDRTLNLFRNPVIDQLVRDPSGYNKSRSVSLYLESGLFARGEVLLGGVDPDKFIGPLAPMPVVDEGHWMLHLLAVYVGEASRRPAGLHAILDTGTNGIYMPPKAGEDLVTLVKAGVEKLIDIRINGGVYEIDRVDRDYLPILSARQ